MRRNINLNILMFNNQIYGLTKGQYSPTSEVGKVTKSTPFGSLDAPFNPVSLALGAEASFVAARMDRQHMMETFRRAWEHQGTAFIEIYQNCNVFNDGAFEAITDKQARDSMLIPLEHGQPVCFGDDMCGARLQGNARVAPVAEVGRTSSSTNENLRPEPGVHASRIAQGPFEPTPIGSSGAVERLEYAEEASRQIAAAQEQSGPGDLEALLRSGATWDVTA